MEECINSNSYNTAVKILLHECLQIFFWFFTWVGVLNLLKDEWVDSPSIAAMFLEDLSDGGVQGGADIDSVEIGHLFHFINKILTLKQQYFHM